MKKTVLFIALMILMFSCHNKSMPSKDVTSLRSLFNNKKYQESIAFAEKMIAQYPSDNLPYLIKSRALFNLGNTKQAILFMDTSIILNPEYATHYGYRALMKSFEKKSNISSVVADYDVAIKAAPTDLLLRRSKANYLRKNKKYEGALKELDNVIKLDSLDYSALVQKAMILGSIQKPEEALSIYSKLIKWFPNQATAYDSRGHLYLEQKKYQEALKDFEEVVKIDSLIPQSPELTATGLNNRGYALFKNNKLDRALKDINHSLAFLKSNSYAYRNRALIYFKLNSKTKGCLDLETALSLGFTRDYGDEVVKLKAQNCDQ